MPPEMLKDPCGIEGPFNRQICASDHLTQIHL